MKLLIKVFSDFKIREFQEIIRLSSPIIISQLGLFVVQLVDTFMVGNLGSKELAAVAFGSNVYFFIYIFGIGIINGIVPIVGKFYAQNKRITLRSVLHNAVIVYGGISVLFSILQISIIPLFNKFGQPKEIVELAIPYYFYLSLSTAPLLLFYIFKCFLEGIGNTKIAMNIILFSNLINILLNYILIYGKLGCDEMGVSGAGLATFYSRLTMFIFIIVIFLYKKNLKFYLSVLSYKSFSFDKMINLLKIGLPIAIQMTLEGCTFAITGILMGFFGANALAANQIAIIIANLSFLMINAISSATTIKVSHYYGKNNLQYIHFTTKCSLLIVFTINIITIGTLCAFNKSLPYLFTSSADVAFITANFLLYVCLYQLQDGIQCISIGVLRGIQDVKIIPIIASFAYLIINIPIGCLFAFTLNFGPNGLWYGYIAGLTFAAFYFYRRVSKKLNEHQFYKSN